MRRSDFGKIEKDLLLAFSGAKIQSNSLMREINFESTGPENEEDRIYGNFTPV